MIYRDHGLAKDTAEAGQKVSSAVQENYPAVKLYLVQTDAEEGLFSAKTTIDDVKSTI